MRTQKPKRFLSLEKIHFLLVDKKVREERFLEKREQKEIRKRREEKQKEAEVKLEKEREREKRRKK
jgi:hypothetical protein